ncbi:MAG: UDP-N-acetylmuramoyl-L-alanine--D-glutamate ligase [Alphaproteobacteria bacterium]
MLISELKGKKIVIWGLGQEGKATLRCLRAKGIDSEIVIFNDKPMSVDDKEALIHFSPLKFASMEDLDVLMNSDVVIKAPGVSLYRDEVIKAKQKGIIFTSATNIWFAESRKNNPDMKIIGVTGTKGKSTTSSLIAHYLRVAGYETAIGGNIGVPLVDFLTSDKKFEVTVAEISSYQASDLQYSPDVGVLLNLYPEHIDWHKSHDRYYDDKLNLFAHRGTNPVVLNCNDPRTKEKCANWDNVVYFNDKSGIYVGDGFIMDGIKRLEAFSEIKIRGYHNYCNICTALTVVKVLGCDVALCAKATGDFDGLLHRLQIVGEKESKIFVNDSISTTPETAVAGIEAFADKPIVLIAGGYDREQNYEVLAKAVLKYDVKAVVTMHTTGARIAETVGKAISEAAKDVAVIQTSGLEEAFKTANNYTPKGGVVLMSPAAPSYGAYKDFKERGEHFIRLFKDL